MPRSPAAPGPLQGAVGVVRTDARANGSRHLGRALSRSRRSLGHALSFCDAVGQQEGVTDEPYLPRANRSGPCRASRSGEGCVYCRQQSVVSAAGGLVAAVGGARKPESGPLGGGGPSGARRDGAAGAPRAGAVPRGAVGRRTGRSRLVPGSHRYAPRWAQALRRPRPPLACCRGGGCGPLPPWAAGGEVSGGSWRPHRGAEAAAAAIIGEGAQCPPWGFGVRGGSPVLAGAAEGRGRELSSCQLRGRQ